MTESDNLVEIDDYDPSWPQRFEEERGALLERLGDTVQDIQHIGSTAIPGCAAKPIIDLMVGVDELNVDDALTEKLKEFGYEYFGEFGIPGRHFFRKGDPRTHHLHWVRIGGDFWEHQILFREYVTAHPDELKKYVELKRQLAAKYHHDRPRYTSSKTDFIEALMTRAHDWKSLKEE